MKTGKIQDPHTMFACNEKKSSCEIGEGTKDCQSASQTKRSEILLHFNVEAPITLERGHTLHHVVFYNLSSLKAPQKEVTQSP